MIPATPVPYPNPEQLFSSDNQLNRLYPVEVGLMSTRHWTPVAVARQAAGFLSMEGNVKILDIGSGAGKFCLVGGYYNPRAVFYGVEQRGYLVNHARAAREILGLDNVHFLCQNLTQLDFTQYDHFYFYNAFYENLTDVEKIDNTIDCSPTLYHHYHRSLYKKLESLRTGTKLVTFHTMEDKIPPDFHVLETHAGSLLKYWIKL